MFKRIKLGAAELELCVVMSLSTCTWEPTASATNNLMKAQSSQERHFRFLYSDRIETQRFCSGLEDWWDVAVLTESLT